MSGSGFTNDVMNAVNVNFSGSNPATGQVTADGQLMIGSSISPFVRIANLTSNDASIHINNGHGTIDLSGTAQGFQPNAVLQYSDDFLAFSVGNSSGVKGQLGWQTNGVLAQNSTTDSSHPGTVTLTGGAYSNNIVLESAGGINPLILGGGSVFFSFVISLVTLSALGNRYTANIGISDDTGAGTITNGVYFSYSDNVNSGNWVLNCMNSSVATTSNTSIPAITGWATFGVLVNAGGTSVTFYINNAAVGTISTNIPTSSLCPFFSLIMSSGNTPSSLIDLFWFTINLNNPRPGPLSGTIPANNRFIGNYTGTATSYQVLGTDAIIGVTSTAAARTITMPAGTLTAGQWWRIKDESGGAATNNITISGNGYNIDGAASVVINTNYGSMDIYTNGLAYFIS